MSAVNAVQTAGLVALGGGAGSVARWLLARAVERWLPAAAVPVGVLAVNVVGCLVIGVVLGTSARGQPLASENARLLLATGLCGGFTTFASFSHQALALLHASRPGAALLYIGLSVGGGLLATAGGLSLARLLP